jgi:hypothetical protein
MNAAMAVKIPGEVAGTPATKLFAGKAADSHAGSAVEPAEREFSTAWMAAQSSANLPGRFVSPSAEPESIESSIESRAQPSELSDDESAANEVSGIDANLSLPGGLVLGELAVLPGTSSIADKTPTASSAAPGSVSGGKAAASSSEKSSNRKDVAPESRTPESRTSESQTSLHQQILAPVAAVQRSTLSAPTSMAPPLPPAPQGSLPFRPKSSGGGANMQIVPSSAASLGDNAAGQAQHPVSFPGSVETAAGPTVWGQQKSETPEPTTVGIPDRLSGPNEQGAVSPQPGAANSAPGAANHSLTADPGPGTGPGTGPPSGVQGASADLALLAGPRDAEVSAMPAVTHGTPLVQGQVASHDLASSLPQPGATARSASQLPAIANANPHSILDAAGSSTSAARDAVWQMSPNRVEAGFANAQNSWITVVAERQDGHLTAALQTSSAGERGTLEALLPQLSNHLTERQAGVDQLGVSVRQQFDGQSSGQNQSQGQMAQAQRGGVPARVAPAAKGEAAPAGSSPAVGGRISLRA